MATYHVNLDADLADLVPDFLATAARNWTACGIRWQTTT